MNKVSLFLLTVVLMTSCKSEVKTESTEINEVSKEDISTSIYPESITKVFNAHGGIDRWNKIKTLAFTMEKPGGNEITTVDLRTRAEHIDMPTHIQGYDGKTVWIKEKEGHTNDGSRAKFYRGLMMYFYAMPFIVGDDGIIYEEAEPLTFEDKTYPGVLVSYESGVGSSPDDQYIVYYDDKSGQMQWLGYTVTFGKNEKSKDFHFIRYNNWQKINGLMLPKSMDWYSYENNQPLEKQRTIEFTDVLVSEEAPDNSMFTIIEGAKVIE